MIYRVRLAAQSCPTPCDPMVCNLPDSSVHRHSPGKNPGVGYHGLLQGIVGDPGIKPRSPALQVDSLPSEPPGKPKNTGVDRLSLLQWIFPTQGSNRGKESKPALQADSLPTELRPNKKDLKIFFCFPNHHAASPFQVFAQTVHPETKPSSPSHL